MLYILCNLSTYLLRIYVVINSGDKHTTFFLFFYNFVVIDMKMELRDAVELSKKKWEYIIKKSGDYYAHEILNDVPELSKYPSNCGLCAMYKADGCKGCPLNDIESSICCIEFMNWHNAKLKKDKLHWAKLLLKRLKNILKDLEKRRRENGKELETK